MSLFLEICAAAGGAVTAATGVGLILRGSVRRSATDVVAPAIKALEDKLDKRFDKNDEATKEVAKKTNDLELRLAREFGGNSGGIRQAVNEVKGDVSDMVKDIATLQGKFAQHIQEANK